MLFKLFLILTLAFISCLAEAPFGGRRAPYAPSGFRPHTPFPLPGEYLPPVESEAAEQQQYDPNQGFSFEFTKQRVDFAGQEVQNVPVNQPQSEYGPPSQQPDFVNGQGLPNNNGGRRPFFDQRPRGPPRRPNGQRPFHGRPVQPNTPQQPQPQPNFNTQTQVNFPTQRFPNPATDERFEPQQSYPETQQQQQPQNQPALQYGAPQTVDPRYAGDNSDDQQQYADDELQKQYALDALNAAVENYNRLQENNADKISQGQYFVVNPDFSIQKVQFTTKQNEQEAQKNDFTAELKYTKVGQLKDPLYKYNADGQLVRVVKK